MGVPPSARRDRQEGRDVCARTGSRKFIELVGGGALGRCSRAMVAAAGTCDSSCVIYSMHQSGPCGGTRCAVPDALEHANVVEKRAVCIA